MRTLAVVVVVAAVAAGCGAPTVQVTAEGSPGTAMQEPTAVPGTDPNPSEPGTPTGDPTPETATPGRTEAGTGEIELAQLVLSASELPNWTAGREGAFEPDPIQNTTDCAELDDYLLISALPGWESTFDAAGLDLRSSAQRFGSIEDAAAFMETVGALPFSCTLMTELGSIDATWVEPVEVPAALEQTAGIVFGRDDGLVMLSFHRTGAVVAGVELEGDVDIWNQFDAVARLLAAKLREVAGEPPLPEPTPASRPTPDSPTPAPDPTPTLAPAPLPSPTPRPDWRSHPLADAVIDGSDIGPGWERDFVDVVEAAPADPAEDIEECDAAAPPTLDGLEVELSVPDSFQVIEQMLGSGPKADLDAALDAFRGLADCGSFEESGAIYTIERRELPDLVADEVVALDIRAVEPETQGPQGVLRFVLARYGDVLIGFAAFNIAEIQAVTVSLDQLADLVQLAASRLPG